MKIFDIRDYGARICDQLQTEAIQSAIDACFLAGGGRVLIPCGIYLTGGLRIRTGVQLYLESGAILKGSRDAEDYFGYRSDTIEPVTLEEVGNTPKNGRSSVASQRERERRKNLRTERQSAFFPWCRSYRKRKDLQPCYRGGVYVPYRRPKQRRSSSCRSR